MRRYCYASDAECGAKVARKRDEHERVGVFAQRDGGGGDDGCGISVIEYSEMDAASSSARDEAGELQFKVRHPKPHMPPIHCIASWKSCACIACG